MRALGRCAAMLVVSLLTFAGAARATDRTCVSGNVPVTLAPHTPANQHVYAELCTPTGSAAPVVQLLVHGVTYDHSYWDVPGFDGRYSYVRAANAAGYATLAIDRIGSGASSHPLSALVDVNVQEWAVHQLVGDLRAGSLPFAPGRSFARVILVGHSYGSGVVWLEASRRHDVDAVIATGANHYINYLTAAKLATTLIPAPLDRKFASLHYDPGYLTTRPGTRYADFMAPGDVDPAVVAQDESLKQTVTVSETAEIPLILNTPLNITVPVLVAQGARDQLFCGGGVTCQSTQQLIAAERPRLGPHVPCVGAYLQPGAGHDNVMMRNAPDFFAAVEAWATAHVPADGARASCG